MGTGTGKKLVRKGSPMRRFTELFYELDLSSRTSDKIRALRTYFASVPAADGAWAVFFLAGDRLKRSVRKNDFRDWAGALSGFPEWMVAECYDHVGDLAETLALLLERGKAGAAGDPEIPALHRVVEEWILPLRERERAEQRILLEKAWRRLDARTCLVFNKMVTGGFRVGVSHGLVHRALGEAAGIEAGVIAQRLMGDWRPTAEAYARLFSREQETADEAAPYPFCLAQPLEEMPEEGFERKLGRPGHWQVEWKWDGVRAQLIRRGSRVVLWSRGGELLGEQFPEIVEAAARWEREGVLDGEILAWREGRPAPFAVLQRRLGRKNVGGKLKREAPVAFMAYDLLEKDGCDLREEPTRCRRRELERFVGALGPSSVRVSPLVPAESWIELAEKRNESRARGVEGLMLKRLEAGYAVGRKTGDWWKWKTDPYTADAVLVYANQGHGRRAGLFTDYTFSVWSGDSLVPFAKAYSGLGDAEIRRLDRWIRENTREKHGPVRVVAPELVFEIAFEGIRASKRHKSGVAVRFPRIYRWREDKPAQEADTLETVRSLLPDTDIS